MLEQMHQNYLLHQQEYLTRARKSYIKRYASIELQYSKLKSGARDHGHGRTRRTLPLDISLEDYRQIIVASKNKCYYCGNSLSPVGYSLDRLGYLKTNVVPCCKVCNTIKGKLEGIGFTFPRTLTLMWELTSPNNEICQ